MDDSKATGRLVLWAIELSEFDFIVEFIMGEIDDEGNPLEGFNEWIVQ